MIDNIDQTEVSQQLMSRIFYSIYIVIDPILHAWGNSITVPVSTPLHSGNSLTSSKSNGAKEIDLHHSPVHRNVSVQDTTP